MQIYHTGRLLNADEATISVADAGFTHAVGLFETMAAFHGRVFRLQQHLDRLADSARDLGLLREVDTGNLAQAVQKTLKANKLESARVRLTVTAGAVSLLRSESGSDKPPDPTVIVETTEPVTYDPKYFTDGIRVVVAPPAANPFDATAGHKTLAYWARLRTLRQAASAGAGEAIWLNITNHLASGAVSNLFIVKDGSLFTPIARGEEVQGALPAPVLPGITRAAVIELADKLDLPVQKRMLDINSLLEADEVFLTNSSWQVLPVSNVEKKVIASGSAGPITLRLREALLELIESETTGHG